MASRIPATVVTGFLGAGKTTLIQHLLASAGTKRIALIVNEFGDVGVDGELLSDCGDKTCQAEEIVELARRFRASVIVASDELAATAGTPPRVVTRRTSGKTGSARSSSLQDNVVSLVPVEDPEG